MYIRFYISKFFYSAFLLFFIANNAFAQQSMICATTHYPPYTIFDESTSSFTGLDMDIINPLFEQLNLKLKVINLPWARLKREIKNNKYDCYFSLGKFQDREVFLDYPTTPTHITKIALFYPAQQGHIDFENKVIGVHRGINNYKDISSSYGLDLSTIHKLPTNEVLFQMLHSNRINAVVTSKVVGEFILKTHYPAFDVNTVEVKEYRLPVYVAFKKGIIEMKLVNEALHNLKTNIQN
ncbi:MAG: transporter substrate-binding domain-containing protein [Thalassotalea sp.]|nr:transporter substrate-binding domain-containing protein [Thalassotalea sp.]